MECWALDIVGPLPVTEKGNRYILSMCDLFTRWAEAVPLPDQTATSIAKAIVDNIVAVHGLPGSILTDQGRNFESQLVADLCRLLGIKKIRTTAYHPQGNGLCERFNGSLCDILASLVNADGTNWDVFLAPALGIFRAKKNRSTGFSPFELTFGRTPKCLPDINAPDHQYRSPYITHSSYAEALRQRLSSLHETVRDRQTEAALKLPAPQCHRPPLAAGDTVYVKRPQKQHKFAARFEGPFTVVNPIDSHNVGISRGSRNFITHTQRLKQPPGRSRRPPERFGNLLTGENYKKALRMRGGRDVG